MAMTWQFNGVAPWTDITDWCWDTLPYNVWNTNRFETIYFHNESAYTMFLLRWGI